LERSFEYESTEASEWDINISNWLFMYVI
jgi:hypothetical protein